MALDDCTDDNKDLDRRPVEGSSDPVADRSMLPERLTYLTQEEAAAVIRGGKEHEGFDRWRHLPTLDLHYYPRGTEPGNLGDYIRLLP